MRCLKTVTYLGLSAFLGGTLVWGDQTNESVNASAEALVPASIRAWVELGEFVGDEQLRRLYVNAGTNRFGFMLPANLRVDTANPEKVTLTKAQFHYFITLQIVPEILPQTVRIKQFFPGGIISEETSCEALRRHCSVVKVKWKTEDGLYRVGAMAFVNTPAGVMELRLVSNPEQYEEGQSILKDLLCRAQSNEAGRLKMATYHPLGYN